MFYQNPLFEDTLNRCVLCQKAFKKPKNLQNHVQRVHADRLNEYNHLLEEELQNYIPPKVPMQNARHPDVNNNTDSASIDAPHEQEESATDWNAAESMPAARGNSSSPARDTREEEQLGQTNETFKRVILRGAGAALLGAPSDETYARIHYDLITAPFAPFENADEFTMGRWFVEFMISKEAFDSFPRFEWMTTTTTFNSLDQLRRRTDAMSATLGLASWQKESVIFDPMTGPVPYYYRDPLNIIKYLLLQPAFAEYMEFAHKKEFSEDSGRVYCEMHTADWWWDTQVKSVLLEQRIKQRLTITQRRKSHQILLYYLSI